jgi:small subunit ribosomal protein S10
MDKKKSKENKENSKKIPYTKISILSYEAAIADETTKSVVEQLERMKLKISGPIPLPTKTKTVVVLKSPHKHNKSKEKFCRNIHRRVIILKEQISQNTKNALSRIRIPNTAKLVLKLPF